jgi:S-adenosylmethionine synthetase
MAAKIIRPTIPENLLDDRTRYFINPTGRFCRTDLDLPWERTDRVADLSR